MYLREISTEVYETSKGRKPFQEWIEVFRDKRTQLLIMSSLSKIKYGNFKKVKFLGEGIYEIKINFGPGYRIYFSREKDVLVVLCAGDKSTQTRDIEKAKVYLKDYRVRKYGFD